MLCRWGWLLRIVVRRSAEGCKLARNGAKQRGTTIILPFACDLVTLRLCHEVVGGRQCLMGGSSYWRNFGSDVVLDNFLM
jgi:hypothetical protein